MPEKQIVRGKITKKQIDEAERKLQLRKIRELRRKNDAALKKAREELKRAKEKLEKSQRDLFKTWKLRKKKRFNRNRKRQFI